MSSVSVKVTIDKSGTRRLNINRDITYEQFQQKIKELFELDSDLSWNYTDEENDVVTFSTPLEWKDLVSSWNSEKLLKLQGTTVVVTAEPPVVNNTRNHHQNTPCRKGCGGLKRFLGMAVLLYSIFRHPIFTLFALGTTLAVTYHHSPRQFEIISGHAKAHWRKAAIAYGIVLLLSCKICTLFILAPIAFIAYHKIKKCATEGIQGDCCFSRKINKIKQFLVAHNIRSGEDVCKFAGSLLQGRQCPARVASVPRTTEVATSPVQAKHVEPTAPAFAEVYPRAEEEVVPLPEKVESTPFQNELTALELMGFTNTKLNEHLLRNFNGNLDRVISSLLQLSSMK